MNQVALIPRKDRFNAGVSFAKKSGCRFDPQRKVWLRSTEALWEFVDECRSELTREQYLRRNGLEILALTGSVADTYAGQVSLDHPDSIF